MRKTLALLLALALSAAAPAAQTRAGKTLDIYYIDTEGGQATLFVSPTGESVLVDTGNTGTRDPGRIMEAVKAAGLKQTVQPEQKSASRQAYEQAWAKGRHMVAKLDSARRR